MPLTLEQIRYEQGPYPADVLDGCGTALLLFAGGFRGRNDGIHVCDAGAAAVCVDIDPSGLNEMERLYPTSWRFVCADAFGFAEKAAAAGDSWDVVSVDCPTALFAACGAAVNLWCSVARRAAVVGCGADTVVTVPDGWAADDQTFRSDFNGGCWWQTLRRETP